MVGFPLLYPLAGVVLFELGSKGVLSVVLSPLFYLASLLWVLTGIGLQNLRHWSWYTFGIAQVLATYYNALILVNYSESGFKVYSFIGALALQYFLFRLVAGEMRVPYLFPRIKWWESGIAGMHHLPVDVLRLDGEGEWKGQLLDLSPKGCFIKSPVDFDSGMQVRVRMNHEGKDLLIPGQIVWNAASTVTHPKGVGIRFVETEREVRRKVRIASTRFTQQRDAEPGN